MPIKIKSYTRKFYRNSILRKKREIALRISAKSMVEKYGPIGAVFLTIWAWASTFFCLGYIGFFDIFISKYFSIIDLQYNAFGYLAYTVPPILFISVAFMQFLQPAPDHRGQFAPLFEHYRLGAIRFIRILIFVVLGVFCILVITWPWIWPGIISHLPGNSIVKIFLFGNPVFTIMLLTAIGALVGIQNLEKSLKIKYRTIFRLSVVMISSSALFMLGDTVASLKFDGSLPSELVQNTSSQKAQVMFTGTDFILVKVAQNQIEIWPIKQVRGITINLKHSADRAIINEPFGPPPASVVSG